MLKEIMEKNNLNQKELSKEMNIDRTTIGKWVRDPEYFKKISIENLIKLCNILKCKPDDLNKEFKYFYREEKKLIKDFEILKDYHIDNLSKAIEENELKYLTDMLNGTLFNLDIPPKNRLRYEIMDADLYNNLGEKWGVTPKDLVKKIDTLTEFDCYVLIKLILNWWETDLEIEDIKKSIFGDKEIDSI